MSAPLARAALKVASRGLPVFPIQPDAKAPPLTKRGCKDASIDPRTIEAWWRRWPHANVGIATGGATRLLVLDVDPDSGGEATLAALEREHGALPATVEVITPRGGRHIYLLVPSGRPLPSIGAGEVSGLGAGLDFRCDGGYVLAVPSTVRGRPYAWSVDSGDRFAEAPAWLLERLERRGSSNGTATPPEEWLALVTAGVDEGARNHAIARVAGLLFRRLPDPLLAAELTTCFNIVKCRPPLEPAELKRTLDSIAAREMKRRGLQP